jgi:hypothetical protein
MDGQLIYVGDLPKAKDGEVTSVKRMSIQEYIKTKTVIPSSVIKENVSRRSEALKKQFIKQKVKDKEILSNSASNIDRLAALQRNKNLTSSEKIEKARLKKLVAANYRRAANYIGMSMAISIINLGFGSVALVAALRADPVNTVKSLPRELVNGIKEDFNRAKGSSLDAVAVAFEYITLDAAFRVTGKVTKAGLRNLAKISPKYVKFVNGKFVVRKTPTQTFKVKGTTRHLAKRVQKPSFKRPFSSVADFLKGRKPGQFKKFTKDPGIVLKSQTVKTGAMSLADQAKLAGSEVTAVNAAAQQLTSWLKRKQIIRKPIPGEANFPAKIKNILKKFDTGKKLTTKEFADVNKWLQNNVAPNITLLERSLYLDPKGGLRISRLGIQKAPTATLKDILRGNFRLWEKAQKPQVLIFENAKIAKFPKSLSGVKRKLLAGKKLNVAETNKLIAWQVKTGSGRFKPIGSTIYNAGKELEITLSPGSMIKRIKKVGFRYIEGKKVTFVTAEIFKPSVSLLKRIKLANLGKLTKNALAKLEKELSKKLGRKIKIETPSLRTAKAIAKEARRASSNTPVLRVNGKGLFVVRLLKRTSLKTTRKTTSLKRTTAKRKTTSKRKTTTRKYTKRTTSKRKSVKRKPTPRKTAKRTTAKRKPTPRKTAKRTVTRRTTTKKRKPVPKPKIPKGYSSRTLPKKVDTYYVVEKVRGKFKKLYPKPLQQKDARDFAVYSIDNRLSKTAFFIPLGKAKKVVRPPKNIQGYYSRNNKKVRPFKIRYGKRKLMVNGYIEKRKYFQDTKGEVTQAKRLRAKSRKRKQVKRTTSPVKKRVIKRTASRKVKRKPMKRRTPVKRKPVKRKVVRRKQVRRKTPVKRKRKPIKKRRTKKRK